jgi:5,10-methenyltetrahydrofolate synthetase
LARVSGDADTAATFDWGAWRRDARRCLLAARRGLTPADRQHRNQAIDRHLQRGFDAIGATPVAFCWPMAGEPEPRFAVRRWRRAGSRAALPVVVGAGRPLQFRQWWPGVALARGVYDIPYPTDSAPVTPAAVVLPVVGFDGAGYRLGYGGGLFDRTLAALEPKPITVALGYEVARMRTIHPQPHDVAMDFVVTEAAVHAVAADGLEPLAPELAAERVRALQGARGLAGEDALSR